MLLGSSWQTVFAWSRQDLIPTIWMPDGSYGYSREAMEGWIAKRSAV